MYIFSIETIYPNRNLSLISHENIDLELCKGNPQIAEIRKKILVENYRNRLRLTLKKNPTKTGQFFFLIIFK